MLVGNELSPKSEAPQRGAMFTLLIEGSYEVNTSYYNQSSNNYGR
jgi:hypothetical protein